jgi:HSP20 family molecular chaperone IbpA
MDTLITGMRVESKSESGLGDLPSRMGRAMQHAMGTAMFRVGCGWLPAVNLYELPDKFLVCVDLAGVKREQIDVTVKDRVLRVEGHRHDPLPDKKRVHLLEIDEGFFCREVEIPASVCIDRIEATYDEGFLWVHLPKQ